jgi:hypothetical protein
MPPTLTPEEMAAERERLAALPDPGTVALDLDCPAGPVEDFALTIERVHADCRTLRAQAQAADDAQLTAHTTAHRIAAAARADIPAGTLAQFTHLTAAPGRQSYLGITEPADLILA